MLDLPKRIYNAIANPVVSNTRPNTGLHPASASIVVNNQVIGACHRQEWYRWFGYQATEQQDPEHTLTAITGDALHSMVVSLLRENVATTNLVVLSAEQSFFDKVELISGRTDIFIKDLTTSKLYGCDIKTVGDYKSGMVATQPDMAHILQCAIYLDQYNKSAALNSSEPVENWIILYLARSENYKLKKYPHGSPFKFLWQFSIDLKEGYVRVTDQIGGQVHLREITMEGIYTRYRKLMDQIRAKSLPDRDYEYQYSEEKLTGLARTGKLNKEETKTVNEWLEAGAEPGKLGLDKGDFQCRYCEFKSICYSATPLEAPKKLQLLYNIPIATTGPTIPTACPKSSLMQDLL